MALRDTIKAATKVVPQILKQMAGSTVTTTRYTKTRDAGQRVVNTPTHPIVAGSWYVREISTAHAQRVWGLQSAATAEATLPIGTDVADGDVVVITAGDFAGNKYEVEGGGTRHDPLGNRILVALIPTGKTGA